MASGLRLRLEEAVAEPLERALDDGKDSVGGSMAPRSPIILSWSLVGGRTGESSNKPLGFLVVPCESIVYRWDEKVNSRLGEERIDP